MMVIEQPNELNQAVAANLKTLIHGLMQNNTTELYTGYRELVRAGVHAVPHIRRAISNGDWSRIKYPREIRYIGGLVSVLHDVNEAEAISAVKEIKDHGCDPTIARILNSICRFTTSDYLQYDLVGVRVYERRDLATKQAIRPRLERWLKNVPRDDLRDLERLYVLRKTDLDGFSGNYMPLLFRVNLVWDNPCSPVNPMSWLKHFSIQCTLYHEIGHFVHRHDFGQDESQEEEAEEYAQDVFRNSNYTVFRIGRFLKKALRFV